MFDRHPVKAAAERAGVDLGCWTIRDFYSERELEDLKQRSLDIMNTESVRLHRPNTPTTGRGEA